MGDNLKIFKFRQDIQNTINTSGLPIMAMQTVLELVLNDVRNASDEVLKNEMMAEEKETKDGLST